MRVTRAAKAQTVGGGLAALDDAGSAHQSHRYNQAIDRGSKASGVQPDCRLRSADWQCRYKDRPIAAELDVVKLLFQGAEDISAFGKWTVAGVLDAAACAIAVRIASVSSLRPSPFAPKSLTS